MTVVIGQYIAAVFDDVMPDYVTVGDGKNYSSNITNVSLPPSQQQQQQQQLHCVYASTNPARCLQFSLSKSKVKIKVKVKGLGQMSAKSNHF